MVNFVRIHYIVETYLRKLFKSNKMFNIVKFSVASFLLILPFIWADALFFYLMFVLFFKPIYELQKFLLITLLSSVQELKSSSLNYN